MQLFDGAKTYSTMVGGRELSIETGVLAGLAGGAVTDDLLRESREVARKTLNIGTLAKS